MLLHLRVQNFALIDDVELDLEEGLNILTGETGAGKSLIMGAVNLALGARVSRELLRDAEQPAQVDLLFDVTGLPAEEALRREELLDGDSGEVLLSRRIAPNGRAVNRLNDQIVTASVLQRAAAILIDVHGQHEHQSLLDASRHIDLLDRFDDRTRACKDKLTGLLAQRRAASAELERWQSQAEDKDRLLSLMEFEAQEIDEAELREGEEEELLAFTRMARSSVRLQETCQLAYAALRGQEDYGGGALDMLGEALLQLQRIEDLDAAHLSDMVNELSDAVSLAEDASVSIRRYSESLEYDPEALAEAENRLELIRHLKSKFGNGYEAIMKYRRDLEESIRKITHINDTLDQLEAELARIRRGMEEICAELTAIRQSVAADISARITQVLTTLQFQDPEFAVQVTPRAEIGPKGADNVQFMIRTNVGDVLRPLDKIASGGEISRIMLAIKTVLADRDEIPTLIFDEIDAGISGRTAQRVAEKLAMIARYHQIICITHLPQIAAMADCHLYIEKTVHNGRARTEVTRLTEEASVQELGRMLGGTELTESAILNAQEIKRLAAEWKRKELNQ